MGQIHCAQHPMSYSFCFPQASSLNGAASSNGASSAAATQPGLLLPCGGPGAWDEAGIGHAVVRYFLGDDEQRWFMWYTGRSEACQSMDDIFPSSGSIGGWHVWGPVGVSARAARLAVQDAVGAHAGAACCWRLHARYWLNVLVHQ